MIDLGLDPGVHLHADQVGISAEPREHFDAWSAPRTWTAGEVVTASIMNLHVRDNLIALRDETPRATVYHSLAQSIAHNTETVLSFDSEAMDSQGLHDNAANNSRLTAPVAGTYAIFGAVCFDGHDVGQRYCYARKNGGSTVLGTLVLRPMNIGGALTSLEFFSIDALAAGGYCEVIVWQNSGAALSVAGSLDRTSFGMYRVAG